MTCVCGNSCVASESWVAPPSLAVAAISSKADLPLSQYLCCPLH
jgi:hypothetical protein